MVKTRRRVSFSDSISEFFKVYLPKFSSQQLCIPPAFIRHFKGSIPNKAILKDHTGSLWDVNLEEGEGGLFITNGWQGFAIKHSLEHGDFLIFNFDGKSHFDVKIFGKNGCKKEAAVSTITCTIPVKVEEESEAEQTPSRPVGACKQKYSETVLRKSQKSGGSSGANKHRSNKIGVRNPQEHKTFRPAAFVIPGNPYFMKIITRSSEYSFNISTRLVRSYSIKLTPEIVLHDQNGKKWPMKVNFRDDGRIILTSGWTDFYRNNKLRRNDECLFEFVLDKGNTSKEMHVQVIHGGATTQKFCTSRIKTT